MDDVKGNLIYEAFSRFQVHLKRKEKGSCSTILCLCVRKNESRSTQRNPKL